MMCALVCLSVWVNVYMYMYVGKYMCVNGYV